MHVRPKYYVTANGPNWFEFMETYEPQRVLRCSSLRDNHGVVMMISVLNSQSFTVDEQWQVVTEIAFRFWSNTNWRDPVRLLTSSFSREVLVAIHSYLTPLHHLQLRTLIPDRICETFNIPVLHYGACLARRMTLRSMTRLMNRV